MQPKSPIGGLVFTVGLIFGLVGYMTSAYSSAVATVVMLGVWLFGGVVARALLRVEEAS